MRWDEVSLVAAAAAASSPVLSVIYGEAIRLAGTSDFTIPALEYSIIGDAETELWNPHIFQWDQFTTARADLARSERALMLLFNHDLPVEVGGVMMFMQFESGGPLTAPDETGLYGRMVRFRYTPIKSLQQRHPIAP